MLSCGAMFSRLAWSSALALGLGCGPADSSWDDWDFAFLSTEATGSTDEPRTILVLGSSLDGRTTQTEPAQAVGSTMLAWSPSGDAIAYVAAVDDEAAEDRSGSEGLWAARPDGRELLAHLQPSNASARGSSLVAWSPSGRWVTVGMSTYEPQGFDALGWHLFVVDLDEDLDARTLEVWPDGSQLSWAPDGSHYVAALADVSYDEELDPIHGPPDLYTYDVERLQETWLEINTEADESSATWSPDGEWIAYVSNASGAYEILRWPVAGGTPQRVGPAPCPVASLQWLIADARLLVGCEGTFAVMDSGDGTILAQHEGTEASPSPDGARVIFQRDSIIHVLELRSGDVTPIGPGRAPVWRPVVDP
jgi:Tol biopolymer transport system component